jgi:signal peptidase I
MGKKRKKEELPEPQVTPGSMGKKRFVREYLEPIITAIIIALFIRTFVVQAFKIPSGSMEPTLLVGDHILVNKFIYGVRIPYSDIKGVKFFEKGKGIISFEYENDRAKDKGVKFLEFKRPKRGDIVVFIFPGDRSKDYIKRVIGTEGEKVEVIGSRIYINDRAIEDPWGHYQRDSLRRLFPPMENFGPVVVPKDSLFVMGDNRENSQDSRFWGFVNINQVKGKAFIKYFSWDDQAESLIEKIRWGRLGRPVR